MMLNVAEQRRAVEEPCLAARDAGADRVTG